MVRLAVLVPPVALKLELVYENATDGVSKPDR
jgi:hypothetical protein